MPCCAVAQSLLRTGSAHEEIDMNRRQPDRRHHRDRLHGAFPQAERQPPEDARRLRPGEDREQLGRERGSHGGRLVDDSFATRGQDDRRGRLERYGHGHGEKESYDREDYGWRAGGYGGDDWEMRRTRRGSRRS
jgi:hypothetical protein